MKPDGWNREELVERFRTYDAAVTEIARLGRLLEQGRCPDGWRLVPEEPTEHMLSLARFYRRECAKEGREVKDDVLYVSMVAQAPDPPLNQNCSEEK